ncbi:glucarate transporter [Salmonella enterica subsp. salamae]|uniref:Glucarate transporter n=1 Tax=Salmonella enterica subsp. salamae TaxID=59202 RepID=A0A6D2G1B7_SALER|nr:glucarate transporter [Salmonella enterica subsp. salamae]
MTIILHNLSWHFVFYYIGAIGVMLGIFWLMKVKDPMHHPKVNQAEIDYIRSGGGEPSLGCKKESQKITFAQIKTVCVNRMMIGVYIGQFCVTSITWFFLTWFPTYLYQAKGMSILKVGFVASIPAIAGFIGGLLGGVFSDWLLKRGYSLTVARKLPVICGMLLSCVIVIANYTSSEFVVIAAMSLAFFAKGFGNLGWCVLSDTSPKEVLGIAGGVFNMCGNMASIVTPLVIGVILANTQSFDFAIFIRWLDGTYWSHFISVYRRPAGSHHADIIRSLIVHIANSSLRCSGIALPSEQRFLVVPRNSDAVAILKRMV